MISIKIAYPGDSFVQIIDNLDILIKITNEEKGYCSAIAIMATEYGKDFIFIGKKMKTIHMAPGKKISKYSTSVDYNGNVNLALTFINVKKKNRKTLMYISGMDNEYYVDAKTKYPYVKSHVNSIYGIGTRVASLTK